MEVSVDGASDALSHSLCTISRSASLTYRGRQQARATATMTGLVSDHTGWTRTSNVYQDCVGKCTLGGTGRLVDKVNEFLPFNTGSYALDNGCGGGTISLRIKALSQATRILATDLSAGMLDQVANLRLPGVETQRADAVTLNGLQDDTFTHVLTSFMIQFTPSALSAVRAMHRVLQPGGVAGIAIWGPYTGPMSIHEIAATNLRPGYRCPPYFGEGAWRTESDHLAAMKAAGFEDVTTELIDVPFALRNAEEFLQFWFDSANPVAEQLHADCAAVGESRAHLRHEVRRLVREEYGDGQGIYLTAVLGWERKLGV